MMMSLTSESTILPNAPPMMTPTARSTTLPLTANSLNSLANDIARSFVPVVLVLPRMTGEPASDGRFARFTGAYADHLLHRRHEDLAVTDLARARSLDDRFDRALHHRVADDHLDFHLRQEVDDVLGAAVEFGVSLLPSEPLDLRHGQSGDSDLRQRLADFVELERLDDRLDLLHRRLSSGSRARGGKDTRSGRHD